MAKLFTPFKTQHVTLKNRIVMSPMCMYSSVNQDGQLTPFHFSHYISRAAGQVGLIMVEATAVQPEGRISNEDLGIWDDRHIEGFNNLNKEIKKYGAKSAIQLAHAGRKATVHPPIFAPSPLPFRESSTIPTEMSLADIRKTIKSFKDGARRAKEAGFDIIEIHAAHGYLINEFLSPLTNQRQDDYGGKRENRYRFLQETIKAIKTVWHGPLFVRISANEYQKQGNTLEDFLYYVKQMKYEGVDLIDSSSGGVVPASIKTYPGYQVTRGEIIRKEVAIATGAVGLITSGIQAEEILQNERADLIFIGRALLRNPYWPKAAADELGVALEAIPQYKRGWN